MFNGAGIWSEYVNWVPTERPKSRAYRMDPRKFIGIKKKEGQNDLPKDGSVKKIQKISMVKCESWNAAIGHTKLNLSKIL